MTSEPVKLTSRFGYFVEQPVELEEATDLVCRWSSVALVMEFQVVPLVILRLASYSARLVDPQPPEWVWVMET